MIACFAITAIGIACERRRMPHLLGEPVVLVTAPTSRSGSEGTSTEGSEIVCASEEALQYGVHSGQELTTARSLCPDLIALPYDRETYLTSAEALWDFYTVESSLVEPFSPELCYVDLTDHDAPARAAHLSALIATRAGCPVYVGLGNSKFIAREAASRNSGSAKANTIAEPIIVHVGDELLYLSTVPLSRIPEVDRKSLLRFGKLGIKTLGDIGRVPSHRIPKELRQIGALLIQRMCGHDSDPIRPSWPPPSVDSRERFDEAVCDEQSIHASLNQLAVRISTELRKQSKFCREVTLSVGLDDLSFEESRERFRLPIADAPAISRAAVRLLRTIVIEQPIIELRLSVSGIDGASGVQLTLLDEASRSDGLTPHERRSRLDSTISAIRRRWGPGAIVPARTLRQARRIGLWTYSFVHRVDEPIRVAMNGVGRPLRYWEKRQRHSSSSQAREITCIFDRWRERKWFLNQFVDATAYRVETNPWGISEIQRVGVEWTLTGRSD